MTRLIHEADFKAITACDCFNKETDFVALEHELCRFFFDKNLRPDYTPPPGKRRKLVKQFLTSTNKQMAQITKMYGFTNENAWGEEFKDIYVPPDLEGVVENLEENKALLSGLLEQSVGNLGVGRLPEKYFSNVICRLAEIFIEYTGLPVTTDGNTDDRLKPPMFHDFSEKCFLALRYEVPDSFEAKLHRTVGKLRKQGHIPKNK